MLTHEELMKSMLVVSDKGDIMYTEDEGVTNRAVVFKRSFLMPSCANVLAASIHLYNVVDRARNVMEELAKRSRVTNQIEMEERFLNEAAGYAMTQRIARDGAISVLGHKN